MISVRRLFVFAIMAVMRLECNRGSLPWNKAELSSPITSYYEESDTLKVNIILKEIPRDVKQWALYFNNEFQKLNQNQTSNSIPSDKKIYFERKLPNKTFVSLDLYLFKNNQYCSIKRIIYGMLVKEKTENKTCFGNNDDNPCDINVEFGYQCKVETMKCKENKEQLSCKTLHSRQRYSEHQWYQKDRNVETMKCKENKEQLSCKTLHSRQRYSEHQWYQKDRNGSLIGTIPMVKGKKSEFIFQIHKFDIMSTIIYDLKHENSVTSVEKSQFQLRSNYEPKRLQTVGKIRYSELKNATILCLDDQQVGLIDPTGEKITTYNVTKYSGNHGKTDSGSMLCCLRYNIKRDNKQTTIQRYVENVNVLLYEEQPHQDNTKGVTTERSTTLSPSTSIPESTKRTVTQKLSTTETTLNVGIKLKGSTKGYQKGVTTERSTTLSPSTSIPESTKRTVTQTLSTTETTLNVEVGIKLKGLTKGYQKGVTTERITTLSTSTSIPEPTKRTVTQKLSTTETTLNVEVSPVNLNDPQEKNMLYGSPGTDHTIYYIAMASVAGIILFVSLIYVIVKKCTRKASNPETLELETYASTNIIYAELDIKTRQDHPRSKFAPAPTTADDTTYAQIMGVVLPVNNH